MGDSPEVEKERLAIERDRLELEKQKAKDRPFLERHLAAVLTAVVSIAAVVVSASQVWMASRAQHESLRSTQAQQEAEIGISQQAGERDQVRVGSDVIAFVLENEDKIKSRNPEDRRRFGKLIEDVYPPRIAQGVFEYLISISDDEVWHEGRTAAIERAKLQPVYLFRIPLDGVDADDLEKQLKENVFPDLQVYQRNVRGTFHTLFRSEGENGNASFLWMLELDLVGSGTAVSGVDRVFAQMGETLKDQATLSQAYIKTLPQ